jgi:uncharacterized membrane protein YgcG
MLVLITAITVGFVLAVIIFGYNYVRLFASQGQTKNAIDAASLAAASDLSRIVVNTKECGYVSLSDSAPTGPVTLASDQFYLPVRSINSLVGTCRLENQLAIQLKDPVLSALAQYDLQQAQSAISQLETVLSASLKSGGQASDIYGNPVTVYADAEAAYKNNDQRVGQQYVPSSLTMTLGGLSKSVPTNIPVPLPTTMNGLQTSQSQGGYYLSDMAIPFGNGSGTYGSQNIAFAAVAQSTRLVDSNTFTTTVPSSTTSQMFAVVKAQATEKVVDSQNPNGLTLLMTSCAIPANNYDPRPAPGALSISFPDGQFPDWKTPMDMLSDSQMAQFTVDMQQASGGDYPTDNGSTMSQVTTFWIPQTPSEANIARVCVYDWVRRAGTKANIQAVVNALNTQFQAPTPTQKDWWTYTAASQTTAVDVSLQAQGKPQIPQGIMHIYKFNADGTVAYTAVNTSPWPYSVLSQNQLFGEALGGFQSASVPQIVFNFSAAPLNLFTNQNNSILGNLWGIFDSGGGESVSTVTFSNYFDTYFRDEVRQPGKLIGGKHGGEPLNNSQVALNKKAKKQMIAIASSVLHGSSFDFGGGGSGAFNNNGHGGGNHGNGSRGGGGGSGINGQGPGGNTGGWGGGATPMVEPQSDFGENSFPKATYTSFPTGSGQVRPTYTTNGTAIDIRFRRQLTISAQMQADLSDISDIGYLGFIAK